MGRCFACEPPEDMDDDRLMDHVRVMHPDVWGDGPELWPDGKLVIIDETLEPVDFAVPSSEGGADG